MRKSEVWKTVPGFLYCEVSSYGRVRSTYTKRLRKIYWNPECYDHGQVVVWTVDRRRTTQGIHRLVALAFHGPCPPAHEAAHKDHDTRNNKPENIEYTTHTENIRQSVRVRRHVFGERHPRAHMTVERVTQVRRFREQGHTFSEIAHLVGIRKAHVQSIVQKRSWAWVA